MATYSALLAVFVACISVSIASVTQGPLNQAELVGDDVVLLCEVSMTGSENPQFIEYVTNPNGSAVSNGNFLIPSHPNYFRYQLTYDSVLGLYELTIRNTVLEDAGRYACRDEYELPEPVLMFAEVVMIEANPNCTTTMPTNGILNLDQYYTAECLVEFKSSPGITPWMEWSGSGNFVQASTSTSTSRWSGMSFNAEIVMDSTAFLCTANFTTEGFGGENTASNVPTWSYTHSTGLVFIQYSPRSLNYAPKQESYEIGQVLTCTADAVPLPIYSWTKLPSGETLNSQSITLLPSDVGNIVLRCQAINSVGSADIFANITVNPITTPTIPTTTIPAPTVPDFAPCDDLTGRWEYEHAEGYTSVLCLNVDQDSNGLLGGLLWNDTRQTYYIEIIGRTTLEEYTEVGFSALWPTRDGVSSFAGECFKCLGEESLVLNALTRRTLDHAYCFDGIAGTVSSPRWTLTRKPISFPCSANSATLQQTLSHSRANSPAKRRRRMANNHQA